MLTEEQKAAIRERYWNAEYAGDVDDLPEEEPEWEVAPNTDIVDDDSYYIQRQWGEKLTGEEVIAIRKRYKAGETINEITYDFDVSQNAVRCAAIGLTYKWVTEEKPAIARGATTANKRALSPSEADEARMLRRVHKWTWPKIARRLGVSKGTAKKACLRGYYPEEMLKQEPAA